MSFTNVYYKRTAASAKACFVCSRPSTTVLATKDSVDFFYACEGHLKDPGFASPVGESSDGVAGAGARKLGVSDEEIQKIKEGWERKQQMKREEEKDKEAPNDKGKDDVGKEKPESKAKDINSPPRPSQSSGIHTPAQAGTHQRYTLHRDFFAMRLGVHRKRRQAAQAKEIAPRLPSAPRVPVHKPQN